MATNEDLAIAFLCLCDKKDKDDILTIIEELTKHWDDKVNIDRIRQSLQLPTSLIARKIALLHTGLYCCPNKKRIYEEMANRVAEFSASLRSPLIKPKPESLGLGIQDHRDHVMPLSLGPNQ